MVRSRFSTLRARLTLVVTAAVIPVTAGILYIGWEQRRRAMADVEREALALAVEAAREEDHLVLETRQLLSVLAQVPSVRGADPARCRVMLAQVMTGGDRYANLGVIGADGRLACSVLPFTAPLDLSERHYFRHAVETGDFAVGEYQIGLVTGVASVNFGYPLLGGAGGVAGVVFAAVPLTWLQERLRVANLPEGTEVLVVDPEGTVLARYPGAPGWTGRSLAGTGLAARILSGTAPVTEAEGLDGVTRLYATRQLQHLPEDHPVTVSVGIPTEVAYAPVMAAVARNLILLAVALTLVLVFTWWTSGRLVLGPIRRLLLATHRLSGGDFGTRAELTGAPREIEELATAFNEMAATLERDVREIGEHLEQISRLNRVRAVLSGINSAILRIDEREELLREVCRICVEEGAYVLAWVAEPDPDGSGVRVVARAVQGGDGVEDGEETVPAVLRSDEGMAAAVLREGSEMVSNDLQGASWGEEGRARVRALGFRSGAALPLRVEGRVVAVLSLYTTGADFFSDEEVRLLRELAADTSLGLEYLEKEKRLQYLANYDALTDLPNRTLFMDHLRQAIGRARQEGGGAAVLLVGIDRLAEINAALGHQSGDLVLQTVARRLGELVGEANTAARLTSNDFGIVLSAAASVRKVASFANRLLDALPAEVSSGKDRAFLSFRIGIAAFPHDGDEPDTLVRAATLALRAAALTPGHPIAFHSTELNAEARRRRRLEQALRTAVANDELALFYQPVIDLTSGEPIGMEALVRWNSPELGEVSPGTFIPLAEEIGIVGEVGEWVLARAAREGRRLHEMGFRDLRMNVNVSVGQIRDPVFLQAFTRIIQETGIDLARLGIGIEITESELMENIREAGAALESFREMGMWIYIDDFGTGYSSLSYLRMLPINSLKIDRSFIHDIPGDEDAVAVVRSIIALARSLGLRVIAEGVETEEQLAVLRELGCDAGQGFLFSRPISAEELESFLNVGSRA